MIAITVECHRGGTVATRTLEVKEGTLVRAVVREAGYSPEGSAVFLDGVSVPRDLALRAPVRLTVVPTFSGG